MKFILSFLFFILTIQSVELVLKSGEVFIGDLVSENSYQVKINWKDKEYTIPRQDIETIDLKKKGKHISYKIINFKLKDGSWLKGAIAEENKDNFVLKTDLGFLTIDKSKIKSNDFIEEPKLPESYQNVFNPEKLKIGFYGTGLLNSNLINKQHPNSYGGGIFIEPVSLLFYSFYQFGYKGELIVSDGSGQGTIPCLFCSKYGRYDFLNNYLYIKYNLKKQAT